MSLLSRILTRFRRQRHDDGQHVAVVHPGEAMLPDGKGGVIHYVGGQVHGHYSPQEIEAMFDETED